MNLTDARRSRPGRFRPYLAAVLAVAIPALAVAVEPSEEFLQGLQDRGLSELSLDYLEQMQTSRLASDEFKRQIPFHRSVVLINQSRQTADPAARNRLLDEARAALQVYAEANPESVQGAEAHLQLASVELSRGQHLLAQAVQLPEEAPYDAERRSLGREARALFANARKTFSEAEDMYSAELQSLPPGAESGAKGGVASRRQEYRARVAQLRFLAAQARFETALSYPRDDPERRKQHEAAAKELAAVYDEFGRTFIVGLYAHLYEGRCYQAIGEYQQALGCFEDILAQPNVLPPFRKLIASAVHRKADVLIEQEKYDDAIETANLCLRDASDSEEKQPEWLAVRFRLAEALRHQGESLSAEALERRKLLAVAREAYRFVANLPGEFQAPARTAAVALAPDNDSAEKNPPKTFQAAYDAGKDALASYNAAKLALPIAERNHPAALPEIKAQMAQGKEDARYYFRAATTLVDDDTDLKLLNEVRYFLCWLYWENEDYYRAAVLGEFLARRYPDHPAASSAAKLAMASFERLYNQVADDGGRHDTEFEARRMANIAEFVVRRWPDTPDAAAARSVLVSYAIRTNRIDEAEKQLANASPEARPQLELQLGSAMWARYLELAHDVGGSSAADATREQLKASALKLLGSGIASARKQRQVSELAATACLYLVQAKLNDEQYGEAITLLEDREIGPLALVSQKHPAAARPQYAIETYKAALRAYVMTSPPQAQKALELIESLEKAVHQSGANQQQLTQIYLGLGIALQKHLEQLRRAGRTSDADRVASAFTQFLDKIAARQADADWTTRAWVAQTYYKMAIDETARSSPAPSKLSGAARDHLTKARDAYVTLLADATKDPSLPRNKSAVLAAQMQLGECFRELGQYQQALDTFSAILKEKESSLSVQCAAAYTYQHRGQAENPQWLERAIHGGYKLRSTGENRIWGWLKISQVAARAARADEKYRDTFYEARANVARCRYLAALKQSDAARDRDLAKAKQSIQSLIQLYPDLGGAERRAEFDSLLKQIQVAAGEPPAGLREFSAGQSTARPSEPRS